MTLGERIAAQRTERRLSQSDLAEQLEVSRQSVSKWETDASVPELDKLTRMCEIFDLTMDQLVRGIEPEQPPAQRPQAKSDPVKQGVTIRQITGITLLAFGALVFLLVALLTGQIQEAFLLALPLLVLGAPCVLFKRTPLWYWWVLYGVALWLLPRVIGLRFYHQVMMLPGLVLLVVTIRKVRKKY